MHDVVVIGGGVIGLSIARDAAAGGNTVLLLERDAPGEGASWAAAGMLAPQSEAERDGPLFRLGLSSLRRYPGWAAGLRDQTGVDLDYGTAGMLWLSPVGARPEAVSERWAWQKSLDLPVDILSAAEIRELEPRITMATAGVFLRDEHRVTPRLLIHALKRSCAAHGVEVRAGCRVDAIAAAGGRVSGLRIGAERIQGGQFVVASGVWSSEIAGLQPGIPVFPRKGQILSLQMPPGFFQRMIRWGTGYAVPRSDGVLVVGATDEDAGFNRSLTPAGIGAITAEIGRMSADAALLPILDMWTGLRPATPDGLPVIGPSRLKNLIYATGHYRNGILLAPITAAIVAALLKGDVPAVPVDAFRPDRFDV